MTIREPWAVYETDDGASATGNGPTLAGGTYEAAIVGDGVSPGAIATVATAPGITLGTNDSTFSLGMWLEIVEGSFTFEGDFGARLRIDDGSGHRFALVVIAGDGEVVNILLQTAAGIVGSHPVDFSALANGWYHFAVSVTSGTAQLYFNGVAVGSTFSAPSGDSGAGNQITYFSNNEGDDILNGPIAQGVIASVAYTAQEWSDIYNGGDGLPYENWDDAGGGGSNQNFLTMGCG